MINKFILKTNDAVCYAVKMHDGSKAYIPFIGRNEIPLKMSLRAARAQYRNVKKHSNLYMQNTLDSLSVRIIRRR